MNYGIGMLNAEVKYFRKASSERNSHKSAPFFTWSHTLSMICLQQLQHVFHFSSFNNCFCNVNFSPQANFLKRVWYMVYNSCFSNNLTEALSHVQWRPSQTVRFGTRSGQHALLEHYCFWIIGYCSCDCMLGFRVCLE